ncbi:MAG: hypothetical protein ACYDCK_04275 [Thermoplasmatota archaeon]
MANLMRDRAFRGGVWATLAGLVVIAAGLFIGSGDEQFWTSMIAGILVVVGMAAVVCAFFILILPPLLPAR